MSRSIDSRKSDRLREQKYAITDGVPFGPDMTELEKDDIKKSLYKLNSSRKKQAVNDDRASHVELTFSKDKDGGHYLSRRLRQIKGK